MSIVVGRTVMMALSVAIAMDALLRFPSPLRALILLGITGFGVWLIRGRLWPALAPPMSRVRLALLVEKNQQSASGRLASGVEFASNLDLARSPYARKVEATAISLVSPEEIAKLVTTTQLRKESVALGLVIAVWVGFFVVSSNLATTGLMRIATPWIAVEWPARTGVRSITFASHHPQQTALALRADLFRGDPTIEPVWVQLRRTVGGVTGEWEKLPLIHQGETKFERLLETDSDSIEFQFLTRDVATTTQRIEFVDAPTLASVIAIVTPPQYANTIEQQRFDLGRATHNQGRIPTPVLQESTVVFEMTPTSSIETPTSAAERKAWIQSTFQWTARGVGDGGITEPQFGFTEQAGVWTLVWSADQSRTLMIRLVDQHGVSNVEEIQCTVDVTNDRAPEAFVVEPSADETVLPTAKIPLRGEARDDVGLQRIALEATRAEWQSTLTEIDAAGVREMELSTLFEISTTEAMPGDLIEVTLVAHDALPAEAGVQRMTRSPPRRFRVLTAAQFEDEARNILMAIRQGALRLHERQGVVMDRNDAPAAQVRPQTEISERIAALRTLSTSLSTKLDRNQIVDDATRGLLDAVDDIVQTAHDQSESARDKLQAYTQFQAETLGAKDGLGETDNRSDDETRQTSATNATEQLADAKQAQGEVREELNDLATLLDRDKDAWMATQKLERVAEAIAQADAERARSKSTDHGETIGRSRDELSAQETAMLDHAAQTAKSAAQAAREALEELKSRAASVQQDDPSRSAHLMEAANRGDRESLSARLDQAEQATRENHMDQAEQASAAAMKTVQMMIEDLADDEKSRTESLRRKLASLADAIEQLVSEARSTEDLGLALLTENSEVIAEASPNVSRLAAQLSLNASGVADDGRAAGPSAQRVVRLLDRGAQAEGRAAGAFVTAIPDVANGHESLVRGSALFREALAVVREQEQKNEEQARMQRARELAQTYQALWERQEGVLVATTAIVTVESSRRTLVEARRLAVEQDRIKSDIAAVRDGSDDVRKSLTFSEATTLSVDAATRAAADLRGGAPTDGTIELEREVLETLKGLANALSEASKKEDHPFSDPEQQAGGAGGGGGGEEEKPLIPPLAELKVLRALQQRIYDRTKAVKEAKLPADAINRLSIRQDSVAKIADALREEVEKQMRERESQAAPTIVPPTKTPDDGKDPT